MPLILGSLLLVLSFFIIKPFLIAVFLGGLLAYIFYPVYLWLTDKVKNKSLASLLICFFVLLVLVIPTMFFLNLLIKESYLIYILVKQRLAEGLFTNCQQSLCQKLQLMIQEPDVQLQIQEVTKAATNLVIQKSSGLLWNLPKILVNLVIFFFTLFYFLKDGETFLKKSNQYLQVHQQKLAVILKRWEEIVHGIVFGYFLVALMQGTLGGLGFYLFGVSSPIFWGLVMALLALIPFLGTGLIWIPAALFLLFDGIFQNSNLLIFKGVALFVYSFIFVSTLDNFIRPKLIGTKAKIHPAIILLGIFGGIFFFGSLGLIIGPLVLSITSVVIDVYLGNNDQK